MRRFQWAPTVIRIRLANRVYLSMSYEDAVEYSLTETTLPDGYYSENPKIPGPNTVEMRAMEMWEILHATAVRRPVPTQPHEPLPHNHPALQHIPPSDPGQPERRYTERNPFDAIGPWN